MDHDRLLARAVLRDVFEAEALRDLVVELERRALPLATEGVLDLEIDLRPVERAATRVDLEGSPERLEHGAQRRLGLVPGGWLAEEALGPRREVEVEIFEPEQL